MEKEQREGELCFSGVSERGGGGKEYIGPGMNTDDMFSFLYSCDLILHAYFSRIHLTVTCHLASFLYRLFDTSCSVILA